MSAPIQPIASTPAVPLVQPVVVAASAPASISSATALFLEANLKGAVLLGAPPVDFTFTIPWKVGSDSAAPAHVEFLDIRSHPSVKALLTSYNIAVFNSITVEVSIPGPCDWDLALCLVPLESKPSTTITYQHARDVRGFPPSVKWIWRSSVTMPQQYEFQVPTGYWAISHSLTSSITGLGTPCLAFASAPLDGKALPKSPLYLQVKFECTGWGRGYQGLVFTT